MKWAEIKKLLGGVFSMKDEEGNIHIKFGNLPAAFCGKLLTEKWEVSDIKGSDFYMHPQKCIVCQDKYVTLIEKADKNEDIKIPIRK